MDIVHHDTMSPNIGVRQAKLLEAHEANSGLLNQTYTLCLTAAIKFSEPINSSNCHQSNNMMRQK